MKTFTFKLGKLYLSQDLYDYYRGDHYLDLDSILEEKEESFSELLSNFNEYVMLYGQKYGLKDYAVLDAHGQSNGRWVYLDGDKEKSVQGWIDSVDGRYAGILLYCCNPGHHTPIVKKSCLIVPDANVYSKRSSLMHRKDSSYNLIVPGREEEIDLYTIDYETKQLRSKIN